MGVSRVPPLNPSETIVLSIIYNFNLTSGIQRNMRPFGRVWATVKQHLPCTGESGVRGRPAPAPSGQHLRAEWCVSGGRDWSVNCVFVYKYTEYFILYSKGFCILENQNRDFGKSLFHALFLEDETGLYFVFMPKIPKLLIVQNKTFRKSF